MLDQITINPFIIFLLGTILLYYSSELLVSNAIIISKEFNISKLVIGGTIIALGTSLPEIVVSILANIKGNSNIVIGNIVGSNVANIGFVLGISLYFKAIYIDKHDTRYKYNILAMLFFTIVFHIMLLFGGIPRLAGFILLCLYVVYFLIMVKYFMFNYRHKFENYDSKIFINIIKVIGGIILIYFGSNLFIDGAIGISKKIGIHDLSIGMTIVALGTSAPELITSLNALKKNEEMLAIGNIVGSNIANIVFAGGISSMIRDIYIKYNEIVYFSNIMLFITIILILIILFSKKIYKIYSLLFISIYFIFIYLNFYNN